MKPLPPAESRRRQRLAWWARRAHLLPPLVVALAGLVVAWDLLAPWDINGHSVYYNQQRLVALDTALRLGYGYRWLPSFYFGHGSPLFNYIAPLPYLVAEIFMRLGLAPSWAIKAVYLLGVLGLGFGFLWLGLVWAGRWAGLAAGLMAVSTPYFLVNLYVRANLGEVFALGLVAMPLVAIVSLARRRTAGMRALLALSVAALVLSHNAVALLFCGAYLVVMAAYFLQQRDRRFVQDASLGLLAGLGLSAFFWLPALAEIGQVRGLDVLTGAGLRVDDHFVTLAQVLADGWGYGVSGPGDGEGMPLQAGRVHLLFTLIAAGLVLWRRERRDPLTLAALALGALSLFMVTSISAPVWHLLSPLQVLHFPWRFYTLFVACAAVSAGFCAQILVDSLPFSRSGITLFAVCAVLLVSTALLARAQYVAYLPATGQSAVFARSKGAAVDQASEVVSIDQHFTAERQWRAGLSGTVGDEYLPKTVTQKPGAPSPHFRVVAGRAQLDERAQEGGLAAGLEVSDPTLVEVGVFYDRAWRAWLDGHHVTLRPSSPEGLVVLDIPAGQHLLVLRRGLTTVQRVATGLSALTVLLILAWPLGSFWRRRSR